MKIIALFLIRMYQAIHGSFFFGTCRFYPSCSQYALDAIEMRGVGQGVILAIGRILRCQPFCKGGWDPVPPMRGWDAAPKSLAQNPFRFARKKTPIPLKSTRPGDRDREAVSATDHAGAFAAATAASIGAGSFATRIRHRFNERNAGRNAGRTSDEAQGPSLHLNTSGVSLDQ